jgi:RHS repeat-associated protein
LSTDDAGYQYDLDGFLQSKTTTAGMTSYNYSSRGELLNVDLPDGTAIEYIHDPLGRRIAKKVNNVITEKYLWSGLTTLLAIYDGSDNLLMRFKYADGRMPVAVEKAGATYYLAYDQVGTLRAVADSTGNVIKGITYDSFGFVLNDTNPAFEVPFGFAGGLYDKDTGLVRFGYRDYDPDTGRWTAKDPIGFAGGSSDLYGYCLGDGVNLVDTVGLFSWGFGGSIGPISVSWDSARPTESSVSLTSDIEIGGGFSFTFDHPFPESNPPKLPFDINIGPGRWLGFSTDGTKISIKLGIGAGLTPVDISKEVVILCHDSGTVKKPLITEDNCP